MGGEGSGRPPGVNGILNKMRESEPKIPISEGLFLPNYSGLQAVKKTDAPISSGGSGHTIQEEGTPLTQRTNLNFSGTAVTAYDDAANDATIVGITTTTYDQSLNTTDNVTFANISGSAIFSGASAVSVSGHTHPTYALDTHLTSLSGAYNTHAGNTSNPHSVTLGQVGGTTDHTALTNIGTKTHAVLESEAVALSGAFYTLSGANATNHTTFTTNITNLSGVVSVNTSNIASLSGAFYTLSGANATAHTTFTTDITNLSGSVSKNTSDTTALSGAYNTHATDSSNPHGTILTQTGLVVSSTLSGATGIITSDVTTSGTAYIGNVVFGTTSGAHTASNYTQGTLLVIYS